VSAEVAEFTLMTSSEDEALNTRAGFLLMKLHRFALFPAEGGRVDVIVIVFGYLWVGDGWRLSNGCEMRFMMIKWVVVTITRPLMRVVGILYFQSFDWAVSIYEREW
jgi:hypothetical protein